MLGSTLEDFLKTLPLEEQRKIEQSAQDKVILWLEQNKPRRYIFYGTDENLYLSLYDLITLSREVNDFKGAKKAFEEIFALDIGDVLEQGSFRLERIS